MICFNLLKFLFTASFLFGFFLQCFASLNSIFISWVDFFISFNCFFLFCIFWVHCVHFHFLNIFSLFRIICLMICLSQSPFSCIHLDLVDLGIYMSFYLGCLLIWIGNCLPRVRLLVDFLNLFWSFFIFW